MQQQKLVIGVGSPHGDDAVGWRVVDQLATNVPATVQAVAVREPTQILPHLADAERVWIIDGSRSGGRPGAITRLEWHAGCLLGDSRASSHGCGVDDVLRLSSALGYPASNVVIYAIELSETKPATPLTPEVAAAVTEVTQRILAEIGCQIT
ncbi:MAG TPA: hydrogenase maturation protease [Pirellulaceae bacterium]|nr:hydrogenase maturation protease [Pirellulaceae bacterium]